MLADLKAVEKELNELENNIALLKRNYEIFFAGGAKLPPSDLQRKVEKAIKKFFAMQGLSYALRFRYNSLVARYNIYQDLWTKQMKFKEEGKLVSGAIPITKHKTARPQKKESAFEKVFKDYLSSRETTGEGVGSLKFESFTQQLEKQKQALIEKYKCKDVEFYVTVEQGKTKLKARPIK